MNPNVTHQDRGAAQIPGALGPWRILDRIGAGGMGVVYRATRPDLGQRIAALKVIRPGLLDDPAVQARFAREVEVLRRVRDVHISEFLDADLHAGFEGDPAWLATAFIDGLNLRDHVSAHGPLTEDQWWALARGLAQALAVLEIHGITHRDVKPANVIMSQDGPVLIDFGIAVPEDATSLTGTGLVTGSPSWLSPEQAGLGAITPASDIFSLGSLLTFSGTGRPPFGAGATVAVLMAIATGEPDLDGLSDRQRAFVSSLMSKDPARRPTARQILESIRGTGTAPGSSPEATQVMPGLSSQETAVFAPSRPISPPPIVAEPSASQPSGQQPEGESGPRARVGIAVGAAVALAAGVWAITADGDSASTPGAAPSSAASASAAPSTPAGSASGALKLSRWRLDNSNAGRMSVVATIKNTGQAPASGTATARILSDGAEVGTATGRIPTIAPGASAEVTLTGSDPWVPGEKSVTLEVS